MLTNLEYNYSMKKIFFILTFLSFFNTALADLKNNQAKPVNIPDTANINYKKICEEQNIQPKLIFYTSYGKLTYNRDYDRKNLTLLAKNNGVFEEGDLASGLALVDISSEYLLSTASRQMANGGYCIMPKEFSIYIGFVNPIIYISKDLPTDSCLYNLVLRHEQTHQQINVNALEFFIPIIYKKIKTILTKIHPLYVSDESLISAGTDDMTNFYAEKINILVEQFKNEIVAEQQKLDNREQYRYESEVCQRFEKNQKH